MKGINELLGGLNVHLGFKKARMTLLFFLGGNGIFLVSQFVWITQGQATGDSAFELELSTNNPNQALKIHSNIYAIFFTKISFFFEFSAGKWYNKK